MRHLWENVIYFIWCTTLFLSRYLWYLWYLQYFVKKDISQNIAQKMRLWYFSDLEKTCDTCGLVYTAVSVAHDCCRQHWQPLEAVHTLGSFCKLLAALTAKASSTSNSLHRHIHQHFNSILINKGRLIQFSTSIHYRSWTEKCNFSSLLSYNI